MTRAASSLRVSSRAPPISGKRRPPGLKRQTVKAARPLSFDPRLFLTSVGKGRTLSDYRKNEPVFTQGDAADALFYVRKGKVKVAVTSFQGKEAVIAIHGADEFLGEACLGGQPLRLATATALSDCTLIRLDRDTMSATLHSEAALSELFTTYLLSRNGRVEEDLVDQLFNSSEKRLARALLRLANFGTAGTPEVVVMPAIRQETLAEMVGTTRSRISYFMNKFRKLGFIKYSGTLEVHASLLSVVLRD